MIRHRSYRLPAMLFGLALLPLIAATPASAAEKSIAKVETSNWCEKAATSAPDDVLGPKFEVETCLALEEMLKALFPFGF